MEVHVATACRELAVQVKSTQPPNVRPRQSRPVSECMSPRHYSVSLGSVVPQAQHGLHGGTGPSRGGLSTLGVLGESEAAVRCRHLGRVSAPVWLGMRGPRGKGAAADSEAPPVAATVDAATAVCANPFPAQQFRSHVLLLFTPRVTPLASLFWCTTDGCSTREHPCVL